MNHADAVHILAQAGLSILPVLGFLAALQLIDTYRLLALRRVLTAVGFGCLAAAVCWAMNTAAYRFGIASPAMWARSGAPLVEEMAKALYVAWLIRGNRIAFIVDAAICGFAVGAGFSVVENATYIPDLSGEVLLTAAVRGLGTAMMHGGATAIFAVLSNHLAEVRASCSFRVFLPGLLLAASIHCLYNQPILSPVHHAVAILIALPALLSFIFWLSEKSLEKWVGTRLDRDIGLLEMMSTGEFHASPGGRYLRSLKTTFGHEIVCDMMCYLHIQLELSARAKGDLLRREMGFAVPADPHLAAQLRELDWLQERVGRAGKLALAPLLAQSRRDVWQMRKLVEK